MEVSKFCKLASTSSILVRASLITVDMCGGVAELVYAADL